jgi:hypothetical protein
MFMGHVLDLGGLWSCDRCKFPNEDVHATTCATCGSDGQRWRRMAKMMRTTLDPYTPYYSHYYNRTTVSQSQAEHGRHAVPFPPEEAMKLIRKKIKKLKQVCTSNMNNVCPCAHSRQRFTDQKAF